MTPDEKSLLERTFKMTEENNQILLSMRRGERLKMATKLIYWIVIVLLTVAAYYAIKPYAEQLLSAYSGVTELFGDGPTDTEE